MAGESQEDYDRKSEATDRMLNPQSYRDDKKLSDFSDTELQAELKKRKREARTAEVIAKEKEQHNAPIIKQMNALRRELENLDRKLKK